MECLIRDQGARGGKSVSMIGMLVLLLAALLVLPSCFDDDTETVETDHMPTVSDMWSWHRANRSLSDHVQKKRMIT